MNATGNHIAPPDLASAHLRCASARRRAVAAAALLWLGLLARTRADGAPAVMATELQPVDVVAVAPGAGAWLPAQWSPYSVQVEQAQDLRQTLDLTDALNRRLAGITINAAQGNPLQPDVQFRGYTGSPLLGVAQGLAVYQDGVRINEVFGDTVNWDLLPQQAIARTTLSAGANPVFGLNALGGALSVQTKNGFIAPGTRIGYDGGSFGRQQASVDSGGSKGSFAYYLLADHFHEQGWRDLSPSHAAHQFGTFSWQGSKASLDLNLIHARTDLTGNGSVPIQQYLIRPQAIFTAPDRTVNELRQISLHGSYAIDEETSLSALAFVRHLRTLSVNGDLSDYTRCAGDSAILCDAAEVSVLDQNGRSVASVFDAVNHRGNTAQTARGGSLQLVLGQPLWGLPNQLVLGLDALSGTVNYQAASQAAVLQADRATSSGSGIYFPADNVDVRSGSESRSAFMTDTIRPTAHWSVTLSARYNRTHITIADRSGLNPALDGDHRYARLNPSLGTVWQATAATAAYANYSESTRAPTPIELSCADESAPCKLPNDFVSDPSLRQVVAHSWELGLRGSGRRDAPLHWQLGLFQSLNDDDILFQSTGGTSSNEGFFANVGRTRRRGLQASLAGKIGNKLSLNAEYTLLRAQFLTPFQEISANHPDAAAGGLIVVRRGNTIPGLPAQTLKLGADWQISARGLIGVDAEYDAGQYLRGDEANLLGRLGGYVVVNLRASARLGRHLTLTAQIENLFDRRYANFGSLGNPSRLFAGQTDPRFVGPGAPRGVWLGVSYEL